MSTAEKVELLRYELLHQRYDYEMDIYYLLHSVLYAEVDRIEEKSFSFRVIPQDNKITARQFLVYTNEFIKCMKRYFTNIIPFEHTIKGIICGSRKELNDLFDCQCDDPYSCYDVKDDKKIRECIYKIIIGNFIKNAKFVPQIEPFLKENDIPLKQLTDYNLEESEKILKLLSDIVFSQRGRCNTYELFENIEDKLQDYLKHKSRSKSKKYTLKDFEEKYINDYIDNYSKMFKSFTNKKKYLKYFI